MNKKVSIIIPCFNGERFIDRCLHSIEIQNYPHIEVVVVNDGSIDQSESKILEWKEVLENKKISLIYIKQKNPPTEPYRSAGGFCHFTSL